MSAAKLHRAGGHVKLVTASVVQVSVTSQVGGSCRACAGNSMYLKGHENDPSLPDAHDCPLRGSFRHLPAHKAAGLTLICHRGHSTRNRHSTGIHPYAALRAGRIY